MLFRRWGLILGWCWAAAAPLVGVGAVNPTTTPDVFYTPGSTRKICQLVGDTDYQWLTPTENLTETRAGLYGTDLGVPFLHNGRTYVVFGDTWGEVSGDRDPIAYTIDTDPEDGIGLTFYTNASAFRPITIPGIAQGAFNVPLDGVSVNNKLYLYHSTDHSTQVPMGRSVLAVSQDDGWTFTLLYTLSRSNFINVSVNKVNLADWPGFPQATGDGLALFGSGSYRASNVRLAFQPAASIEDSSSLRYFAGLDAFGNPTWSPDETASIDLFNQPVVGELSVAYNKFLRRWIMLYNSDDSSRGINFRTALQPWGPWSANQVLLDPWSDGAYGNYFHVHWSWAILDNAQNPGREYEFGGEYGPYLFKELATGSDNRSTLYFTLSSWNPYVSLLMKTELVVTNVPVITRPPTDQQAMAGQSATFELTASAVGSLNYSWARNGTVIGGATDRTLVLPSVGPADNGAEFRCRAANSVGAVTSSPVYLTVVSANQAPQPQILTPLLNATYAGGQTISFSGAATDPEDGSLPAGALSWQVLFCHGNYTVPFLDTVTGVATGAFTAPLRGETSTNVCFRIYLTARDSGGRETTVTRDIFPRVVTLTLQTEPPGLPLVLNGQTLATPTNLPVVAGTRYALGITASSNLTASTYDFMTWSDGGATSHSLTVPETNLTLTAFFRSPTVLVPANALWKYLVTGSDPASSWTAVGFNDSSWASGSAQLGYGDGDEATVIGWGPNSNSRYVTTYFRHTFGVGDPSAFAALLVRLLRDDGAVVYLNGTEVFRSNIGGGAPIWAMLAPLNALPADETSTYYSTNIPAALLLPGVNVLAVEVHQNSVGSTADLTFALELRGVEYPPVIAAPGITAQPQSQTVNQGANATLTVAASGTAPLSYQWRWYGANLAGATASSLTFAGVSTNQSGPYTAVVTNAYGAVTSQVATLTVNPTIQTDGLSLLWSLAPGSRSYLTAVTGAPCNERGIAYNPLTRRLLLLSRTAPTVYVLDGDTGADLWTLDKTGVTGGYNSAYYLLLVGVADDGVVYAGNLTIAGTSTAFKLYRWANDSASTVPTVAYAGDPGGGISLRWGDTLDVRGAGANTQVIIGALKTNRVAVLTTANGTSFTSKLVTLADALTNAVGLGLAFGAGDTFWCKAGNPTPQNLRQASFNLSAGTAATLRNYADPAFPGTVGPIGVSTSLNLLGGVNVATSGNGNNFQLYDLTPTNGTPVFITATNFATDNDNTYGGTGAVDFGSDRVYALSSNNGLLAMQIVPKTVITPPQVQAITLLPGGQIQLQVSGPPGHYAIEATTNLANWAELTNFTTTATTFQYLDPAANLPQRYYRVRLMP